jgi:hypothetical protein
MVKPKSESKNKSEDRNEKNPELSSRLKNIKEIIRYYDVPEEHLTLNVILHKMSEILEIYLKTLQQILQPEEFHAIYECNAFTEKDKTDILELYKRIILAHREILKALIINEEKNSSSTIQFVHQEITSVKGQMLGVVEKMQQSWNNNSKSSTDRQMRYFG